MASTTTTKNWKHLWNKANFWLSSYTSHCIKPSLYWKNQIHRY